MKIWQFIQSNFMELMGILGSVFALFRTRKKLSADEKKQRKINRLTKKTKKLVAKSEKTANKADKTAVKLENEFEK